MLVVAVLCLGVGAGLMGCWPLPSSPGVQDKLAWHGVAQLEENLAYCDDQDRYPNTFFDFYKADAPGEAAAAPGAHPVFVYVHGGGFTGGSKNTQDTSCMGPGVEALFENLLRSGCDVVSMDYTLAGTQGDGVGSLGGGNPPSDKSEKSAGEGDGNSSMGGSKSSGAVGDPLGEDDDPAGSGAGSLGENGSYPTPVVELALLMEHLQVYADGYGIDMDRVAVGGGSAGGHIAGQFAALATNSAYRQACIDRWGLGASGGSLFASDASRITSGFDAANIKAVYLGCALLDPEHFDILAEVDPANEQAAQLKTLEFSQMKRSYFGATGTAPGEENAPQQGSYGMPADGTSSHGDVEAVQPGGSTGKSAARTDALQETYDEGNVIYHIGEGYPPTYLTDGNYLTFIEQARLLDGTLEELGIEHVTRLPGTLAEAGKVPHGYDVQAREDAQNNARDAAAFICDQIN